MRVKPKRFEFTLKTVTTDVFVAEVHWEAVPKTWPDGSKASVDKCVVRPWNSTRSVACRWTSGVDVLDLSKPIPIRQYVHNYADTATRSLDLASFFGGFDLRPSYFWTPVVAKTSKSFAKQFTSHAVGNYTNTSSPTEESVSVVLKLRYFCRMISSSYHHHIDPDIYSAPITGCT